MFGFCLCSPRASPTRTNENKNKNRTFCLWQIERVNEHIITDFVKTRDKGNKVVTTTITTSMVRSAHNRDMCTYTHTHTHMYVMTSHKTECDLNIYELACELIEWAEWEWVRLWIKMWCDNATNHHMECSMCVHACWCMLYICTHITRIHILCMYVCMHVLMSTSNWMLNHTHYTIYNERADFSLNQILSGCKTEWHQAIAEHIIATAATASNPHTTRVQQTETMNRRSKIK